MHNTKRLERTNHTMIVERPDPSLHKRHLCLDKEYDNPTGQTTVQKPRGTWHLRRIGQMKLDEV